MPDLENDMNNDSDNDGDENLEAELAAITAGDSEPKPKPRKPKLVVPPSELDKMIADSLKDIEPDEDIDEDDPDLLNELSAIVEPDELKELAPIPDSSPIPGAVDTTSVEPILPTTAMNTIDILKSRIEMYKMAEKIAKETGDTTRARSRARGLKTLESMLRQAKAGNPVNVEEIPPVVSIKSPNAPAQQTHEQQPTTEGQLVNVDNPVEKPEPINTVPPAPVSPLKENSNVNESKINALLERQREYKIAALTAKKSGDSETALQYVKLLKMFDTVLAAARSGEPIDLSDMPPPPSELSSDLLKSIGQASNPPEPPKQENVLQQSTEDKTPSHPDATQPKTVELPPPDSPKTVLEALTQRLQKYQSVEANAKAEGNDRKARQTSRIVKQYLGK